MQRTSFLSALVGLGLLVGGTPLWATPILVGSIGTESGVPIAGQEDVVVFNLTGPTNGCSTAAGTPICTAVTFKNVVLTINGTDTVDLGDVAPGMTESYTFAGGTYVDGTITSLALATTLSTTSLSDDKSHTYLVDASILLGNLPVDGSYADIAATLARPLTAPEPGSLCLSGVAGLLACGSAWWARRKTARG